MALVIFVTVRLIHFKLLVTDFGGSEVTMEISMYASHQVGAMWCVTREPQYANAPKQPIQCGRQDPLIIIIITGARGF